MMARSEAVAFDGDKRNRDGGGWDVKEIVHPGRPFAQE